MNPDSDPTQPVQPKVRPMMDVAPPQQPLTQTPVSPAPQTPQTLPSAEPSGTPAPAQTSSNEQSQPVTKPPKTRKNLVLVIIVAVVITLLLVGVAIFFYLRSNNTTPEAPAATQTAPTDDGRVGPEDIDQTISEIDNSLNSVNDSTDFGQNDLTNTTIGL